MLKFNFILTKMEDDLETLSIKVTQMKNLSIAIQDHVNEDIKSLNMINIENVSDHMKHIIQMIVEMKDGGQSPRLIIFAWIMVLIMILYSLMV